MARIQVKKYVKEYKFPSGHVKRRYPTASYYIYLPKAVAEKCLDKDFNVKLEGEKIVLEPKKEEK